MIKNICMILVIFLLLGACSGQAADRGKREAPDHKSACQMVYADKHGSVQEFEKFIIENQKNIAAIRRRCFLLYFFDRLAFDQFCSNIDSIYNGKILICLFS